MKNNKKAFIDKIMLGFFLISFVTVFVGTISDELQMRTKYQSLKKITQTAVLSAAKYYLDHQDEQDVEEDAENIAKGIIEQTKLGKEISNDIVFNWDFDSDPNNVIATIDEYTQELFWFRLLGWKEAPIENVSAKANIVEQTIEEADNFVPIAVNGCSQDFNKGDQFDFLLKAYDLYDPNDNIGFFALYEPSGGQSSFAHFKNLVKDVMKNKTSHFELDDIVSISTVLAADIKNDVKQISQSFGINGFSSTEMSIAVLDCNSTADSPVVKKILPIKMNQVYCADCCAFMGMCMPWPMSEMCVFMDMLNDLTGDVFSDMIWATTVNSCNKNELFRINFEVLSDDKVVLEY